MNVSSSSKTVFGYFVNLVSIFGLLTWISILVAHIGFVKSRRAQGVDYKNFITGYLVRSPLDFQYQSQTPNRTPANTPLQGIPLYILMILVYKFIMKTKEVNPAEADLWTGNDVVDADEQEWLAKEAADKAAARGRGALYRHTLGYLFELF